MGMFGGLINCVRTFGNQVINGVKIFNNKIIVNGENGRIEETYDTNQKLIYAKSVLLNGAEYDILIDVYRPQDSDYNRIVLYDSPNSAGLRFSNHLKAGKTDNFMSPSNSVADANIPCKGFINSKLINKAVLYPDYTTQVETAITAQGDTYTALTDGFIQIKSGIDHNGYFSMTINGTRVFHFENISGAGVFDTVVSTLFPVQEGDVCICDSLNQASNAKFFFYSNKGV